MTTEELKQTIERQTGIPAHLIAADTAEAAIAQARSLLEYKREQDQQRPKETREQFAEWARDLYGDTLPDANSAALDEIEEAARVDAGGYPRVRDGGQVSIDGMPDPRPTAAQFEEWFRMETAFDPKNTHDLEW